MTRPDPSSPARGAASPGRIGPTPPQQHAQGAFRPSSPGRARGSAALVVGAGACVIGAIAWGRLAGAGTGVEAEWLRDELRLVAVDRLTATILIGACLGIAGVLLRTATNNPLADPEITGVNSGAAFGAVLATTLTGSVGGAALLPGALAGAVLAASMTIAVGLGGRTSGAAALAVQRMVLLGMAVSALFSALTAIILVLDEAQLATVLSWLSGRLGGVRAPDLWPAAVAAGIVVPVVVAGGRAFDALSAGDSVASSFGARPRVIRFAAVAAAVLLVAPCVAAAGPIGFLGLMSAVATQRICGPRHRLALPVAAVTGAAVLLASDAIGQLLWAPAETPVGIVTALAGVPVLLWGIAALGRGKSGGR